MNDATLERLMMDAALGALNDDVQELLMAHLEGNEKKAREARELQKLIRVAKEAMSGDFPAQPALHAVRRRFKIERAVTWGGRVTAMAACLLIGFGIARMRPAKPIEVIAAEKPLAPPAVAVSDARSAGDGELWSTQRILRNAIEVNRNEKPRAGVRRILQ
jgi:hypothetical protein